MATLRSASALRTSRPTLRQMSVSMQKTKDRLLQHGAVPPARPFVQFRRTAGRLLPQQYRHPSNRRQLDHRHCLRVLCRSTMMLSPSLLYYYADQGRGGDGTAVSLVDSAGCFVTLLGSGERRRANVSPKQVLRAGKDLDKCCSCDIASAIRPENTAPAEIFAEGAQGA